jgi:polyadenylation factor subunit 2
MDDYSGGAAVRRHLTSFNSFDNYLYNKWKLGSHSTVRDRPILQPHFNQMRFVNLPKGNLHNAGDGICSHFLVHGFNRVQKAPVTCGAFFPDARRIILGTDDGVNGGYFTLWEAETFKFERLITASTFPIRAMVFKKSGSNVLILADHGGWIRYFNNNLKLSYSTNQEGSRARKEEYDNHPLRGLSCSPGDVKFASCGDNAAVKIWDWTRGEPELTLAEHHSAVLCLDWHPYRGLIASGSKDNTVKFWDPRQSTSLCTLFNHKNTVQCCQFNPLNGNLLATGSRDNLLKIFDIRMMKETAVYKGHNNAVWSMAWHPYHEDVLVTGGYQGALIYWMMGFEGPHTIIPNAHNYSVNFMQWHPLGHCLATAANDGILKIWGREPPGSLLAPHTSDYQEPLKVEHGPLPPDHKSAIPETVSMSSIAGDKGFKSEGGAAKKYPGRQQSSSQYQQTPYRPPTNMQDPQRIAGAFAGDHKPQEQPRKRSRFA